MTGMFVWMYFIHICKKLDVADVSATKVLSIFFGWVDTRLILDKFVSKLLFIVCLRSHLLDNVRHILTGPSFIPILFVKVASSL